MSWIRIDKISISNYRSFGQIQEFVFPKEDNNKPVAIVGYNNCGKTNLMNSILYGLGEKFVSEKTFERTDLHNMDFDNQIEICSTLRGSVYGQNSYGDVSISGNYSITSVFEDDELKSKCSPSFYGKNKHYNVFYINFHNIKDEISTAKTSWGNLKSFLAKHIQNIVNTDVIMSERKCRFEQEIKESSDKVLNGDNTQNPPELESNLSKFIKRIKKNYTKNLRDNSVVIDFGLPDYEDIFLQMMFKIGLNGTDENLVPIDHFGDGYISMFVMAVIQAIAEENTDDKCLFLFEEPESFLHENHQDYFYKVVLCELSKQGHQVIYTTHSDKMVDIFDTAGLIRLDIIAGATVKKYNNVNVFQSTITDPDEGILPLNQYNQFIKTIEPNLGKMIFSKKVLLVEGPNDVIVYKTLIKKIIVVKLREIGNISDDKIKQLSGTYLNFENIVILPHHGKSTAIHLIKLCKHLGIDYFCINDLDFAATELDIVQLSAFLTEGEMKANDIYTKWGVDKTKKGMVTVNYKLLNESNFNGECHIHFNIPKLELCIGYESNDKDSLKIFTKIIGNTFETEENIFPEALFIFLGLNTFLDTANRVPENDEAIENNNEENIIDFH